MRSGEVKRPQGAQFMPMSVSNTEPWFFGAGDPFGRLRGPRMVKKWHLSRTYKANTREIQWKPVETHSYMARVGSFRVAIMMDDDPLPYRLLWAYGDGPDTLFWYPTGVRKFSLDLLCDGTCRRSRRRLYCDGRAATAAPVAVKAATGPKKGAVAGCRRSLEKCPSVKSGNQVWGAYTSIVV